MILYNIGLQSHTLSIPVETTCLLSYILDEETIDIARVISNELKQVGLSNAQLGYSIACQLTYPCLITGLCKKAKALIPGGGHVIIEGKINDDLIESFYVTKQDNQAARVVPIAATPLDHPHFDPQDDYNMAMHDARRRDFLFMQKSMQQLYLHIGNPHIPHPLGNQEELIAYADWLEGGPSS
ncbi:hypothetical protein RYX36_033498 [Vicia faba]